MSLWDEIKETAIKAKINRAMIMSRGNINSDFDISHPDWIKQAHLVKPNYDDLKNKIRQEIVKRQDLAITRRKKNAPK